jgi:hypothetical protein
MTDQQSQHTFYTILWYEDGGSCWCEECVYNDESAFSSAEEAERYAEEKLSAMDYVREYKIQKVTWFHNLSEKVSS